MWLSGSLPPRKCGLAAFLEATWHSMLGSDWENALSQHGRLMVIDKR